MALVHTNNTGIYAGVSKQAIDLRLPNHCEEMINCYPSIQNGTRRRNPTQQISSAIFAEDNQFMHTYVNVLVTGDAGRKDRYKPVVTTLLYPVISIVSNE